MLRLSNILDMDLVLDDCDESCHGAAAVHGLRPDDSTNESCTVGESNPNDFRGLPQQIDSLLCNEYIGSIFEHTENVYHNYLQSLWAVGRGF
ncbi:hypothetical protein DPMN_129278 [Dreissena polymorpha]|uniref:Uncharacterized protein n=1 Tax=Dreissena polymorpha TaxID=45954 RepID=A0A9D4JWH7_DREPO|nr:hypothetical protein DPMN_129278 [Dreissena polymorpha]